MRRWAVIGLEGGCVGPSVQLAPPQFGQKSPQVRHTDRPKRAAIHGQETDIAELVFLIPAMDPPRKGTCNVGP